MVVFFSILTVNLDYLKGHYMNNVRYVFFIDFARHFIKIMKTLSLAHIKNKMCKLEKKEESFRPFNLPSKLSIKLVLSFIKIAQFALFHVTFIRFIDSIFGNLFKQMIISLKPRKRKKNNTRAINQRINSNTQELIRLLKVQWLTT